MLLINFGVCHEAFWLISNDVFYFDCDTGCCVCWIACFDTVCSSRVCHQASRPFDKWLAGDDKAINEQELRGYKTFKQSGCVACHNGELLGGGSFQKFGVFEQYTTKNLSEGRFAVTGKPEDKMLFKVPTLRNIELTYPYFHDGQVNSLEEAVKIMGKIQLNKDFTEAETADIVAFLKTLTGDQPKLQYPHLPPSNPNTPLPNPFGK